MSWLILLTVCGGVALGHWALSPAQVDAIAQIGPWALSLVLFTIGFDLAQDKTAWQRFARLGWRVLLMPLATVIGSLLGTALIGPWLGFSPFEAMSIGAGLGWYSLSGVILNNLGYTTLGAIAFLSNVLRELIAIASIPWLATRYGPFLPIATGGATTMDTTLSILSRYGTNESIMTALINGIILTAVVPILVPLLASCI